MLERPSLPLQGGRLLVGTQGKPAESEDQAHLEGMAGGTDGAMRGGAALKNEEV